MPDKKPTDSEIVKEIQGIKESMKRHIDLTNEMGQDLLRIDEEYTGGSKVWLTTDYFKKVVKHFSHSNYLVKCLELVFDYINRLQGKNERLKKALKVQGERLVCEREQKYEQIDIITKLKDQLVVAKAEAENERLKPFEDKIAEFKSHIRVEDMLVFANSLEEWLEFCNNLKAEAVTEFAERLKAEYTDFDEENEVILPENLNKAINDLLKEKVGALKGKAGEDIELEKGSGK